jgi:hypothetical protein
MPAGTAARYRKPASPGDATGQRERPKSGDVGGDAEAARPHRVVPGDDQPHTSPVATKPLEADGDRRGQRAGDQPCDLDVDVHLGHAAPQEPVRRRDSDGQSGNGSGERASTLPDDRKRNARGHADQHRNRSTNDQRTRCRERGGRTEPGNAPVAERELTCERPRR